jgi:hypothetical protein
MLKTRRKRLAILAASVMLMAVSLVPAAHAQSSGALSRCRAGAGGNFNTNLIVNRDPAVFGFRSEIWPGDVIRVTATGGIKIDSWPWTRDTPPEGMPTPPWPPAPNGWPAPGKRQYSLVGTFNDTGQQVQLGWDSGCFVYHGSVRTFLWLEINDPDTRDNSGRWDVVIRQFL